MEAKKSKSVAMIVAHPDDETLWAGGTLLDHPEWDCFILCLCRADDSSRAPKFYNALKVFNAKGVMGNLNDDPDLKPMDDRILKSTILELLPKKNYDLLITHSKKGEYTRHIRHEEIGTAVMRLWKDCKISADQLWCFAYEDGRNTHFPKALENADVSVKLTDQSWLQKLKIITDIYEFDKNSWEYETTPSTEAFWQFNRNQKT